MALFIDRPRAAQTRCRTCGEPIAHAAWRIVEELTAWREHEERSWRQYEHLACVLAFDRERVKAALIDAATTDAVVAGALAELADPALAAAVAATRALRAPAVVKQVTALDDPIAVELLARLDAAPADRALLAVLGDHLQQRGDDRGELIALDLAASADPAASARRRELAAMLAPALDKTDKAVPGVGFLRELHLWVDGPLANRGDVLAHPACRLVRTLRVIVHARARERVVDIAPGCLPRGLRSLHVNGARVVAGDLGWLPYLADVELQTRVLRHPGLAAVTLRDATRDDVAACAPGLPAVRTLHLHNTVDDAVVELITAGWLARLDHLHLSGSLDERALIAVLDHGLAGRRLAKLTVHVGGISRRGYDQLAALCDELDCWCADRRVFGAAARRVVEHATKPEWGRGTLVREANGKVDIQFADAVRTFRADAPFLRWLED